MTMTTTATAQSPKIAAAVDATLSGLTPAEFMDLIAHGTASTTYADLAKGGTFWADAALERLGERLQETVVGE